MMMDMVALMAVALTAVLAVPPQASHPAGGSSTSSGA
jgi:hypothetical protein